MPISSKERQTHDRPLLPDYTLTHKGIQWEVSYYRDPLTGKVSVGAEIPGGGVGVEINFTAQQVDEMVLSALREKVNKSVTDMVDYFETSIAGNRKT